MGFRLKDIQKKHIELALLLLSPSTLLLFLDDLWNGTPTVISYWCNPLTAGRWIIILVWLLLLFAPITYYFAYQIYSKRRVQKIQHKLGLKDLHKLETLYAFKEIKNGFPDIDSLSDWASQVAPLLMFNQLYYAHFLDAHQRIMIVSTPEVTSALWRKMKAQVKMAIEQLKNELEASSLHP